jgi:bifunctional DNA-binding transcriptional regulator/antitoxin component of YhaV-PrlF toxin-antitoxin module
MVRVQAKLSSQNQLSLPSKVREVLGVHAHDRVNFVIDGKTVRVEPARLTLSDFFQSVPAKCADGRVAAEMEYEEVRDREEQARRSSVAVTAR